VLDGKLGGGSLGFVQRRTEMVPTADEVRVLQETVIPYGQKARVKEGSKAVN